jgi:hypothetical protein
MLVATANLDRVCAYEGSGPGPVYFQQVQSVLNAIRRVLAAPSWRVELRRTE